MLKVLLIAKGPKIGEALRVSLKESYILQLYGSTMLFGTDPCKRV